MLTRVGWRSAANYIKARHPVEEFDELRRKSPSLVLL